MLRYEASRWVDADSVKFTDGTELNRPLTDLGFHLRTFARHNLFQTCLFAVVSKVEEELHMIFCRACHLRSLPALLAQLGYWRAHVSMFQPSMLTGVSGWCRKNQGNNRSLPVTARSLETLIRLASAHAKARLSHTVEEADAAKAMNLMSFALYHETTASLDEQLDQNNADKDTLQTSNKHQLQRGNLGDLDDDGTARQARNVEERTTLCFTPWACCKCIPSRFVERTCVDCLLCL